MQKFWIQVGAVVVCVSLTFFYNSTTNERIEAEEAEKESYNKVLAEIEEANSQEANSAYSDGMYEGEAQGFGGPIKVSVTIENGEITSIDVLSHDDEDAAYYDSAVAVIDEMLDAQSTDVDVVSGATFSSNGIIGAVEEALGKAEN